MSPAAERMARLDQKRFLVMGRERVAQVVNDLVGTAGARIEHVFAESLTVQAAHDSVADALVVDGHCWESGDVPVEFLMAWQRRRRPFLVLLQARQRQQRGLWLESGAFDVFSSPAPTRRLTNALVEAVLRQRTPLTRYPMTQVIQLSYRSRSSRAMLLELSSEDLLISSTESLQRGALAHVVLSPSLTVLTRSQFCRTSGRYVCGLRIVGVTREEHAALERIVWGLYVEAERRRERAA